MKYFIDYLSECFEYYYVIYLASNLAIRLPPPHITTNTELSSANIPVEKCKID